MSNRTSRVLQRRARAAQRWPLAAIALGAATGAGCLDGPSAYDSVYGERGEEPPPEVCRELNGSEVCAGLYHGSGEPEYLDVMVIPYEFEDGSHDRVESILYQMLHADRGEQNSPDTRGMLQREPFEWHQHKFNFWYADRSLDGANYGCEVVRGEWNAFLSCDEKQIIRDYQEAFGADYIVLLLDEEGINSSAPLILHFNVRALSAGWEFTHEFGHLFGGLADEYVRTRSPSHRCGRREDAQEAQDCFDRHAEVASALPNTDVLGCPKWCDSYDPSALMAVNDTCGAHATQDECEALSGGGICTWFMQPHPFFGTHCVRVEGRDDIGVDCQEGTGCYFGADLGQLAFRSASSGLMGGSTEFNQVSKDHLRRALECCYPRVESEDCHDFRSQLMDLPLDGRPFLGTALEKLATCP